MEAEMSRFNIYIREGIMKLEMEFWTANLKYLLYIHYPTYLTFLEITQIYVFTHSFILSDIQELFIQFYCWVLRIYLWFKKAMPILKNTQKSIPNGFWSTYWRQMNKAFLREGRRTSLWPQSRQRFLREDIHTHKHSLYIEREAYWSILRLRTNGQQKTPLTECKGIPQGWRK